MNPIRILIVDDHSVVRQGLRALLDLQPNLSVVAEASSGEEAVEVCPLLRPDLVIMDLLMRGINGAEASARIKRSDPSCRILILTSFQDDAYLAAAVKAGVDSYLLKEVEPSELIAAVEKTARGESILHPSVAQRMMKALRTDSATAGSLVDPLTDREIEVLNLIADGITNTEIAQSLFISEKTVKTHVSHILAKLGVSDRTQAAVYAWREGLKS